MVYTLVLEANASGIESSSLSWRTRQFGDVVKWDNTSFASLDWEFDSLLLHQRNNMKPTVEIHDCFLYKDFNKQQRLSGIVEDYPIDPKAYPSDLENGHRIYTSRVVKINEDKTVVETERTIYNVTSWIPGPQDEASKT